MTIKDKNGRRPLPGDVIIYDEGVDYARQIQEVVMHEGDLCTVCHILDAFGMVKVNDDGPCPLIYATCQNDWEIVDVPHETAFTTEYAESIFGKDGKKVRLGKEPAIGATYEAMTEIISIDAAKALLTAIIDGKIPHLTWSDQ